MTLAGRVALVTGGGGGIGSAVALRLARDSAAVVVADRDADAAERTADAIREVGGDGEPAHLDVTDGTAVDKLVADVTDRRGSLDILVATAGFPRDGLVTEMTDDDWRVVLDVCLFGTFTCCRAAARQMVRGGWGRIVTISSRAYLGNPGQANYAAAKAGVVGLTKSLAKELGRHGVTANVVAPGLIDTPMVRGHPKFAAIAERAARESSIPRVGVPDDVASAVGWLVSEEAGYVTGDVVHVTGGRFG